MLEDAAGIVKAVDGIPLAIEQAGAVLQEGVAIDEFLSFYGTQYRKIMEHALGKSFSNYEKGNSIFKTFEMLYEKLTMNSLDAANVLTLCSFFGARPVLLQTITQFRTLKLSKPDQSYSSSSISRKGPQHWLLDLLKRELDFRQAIMRLEKLCLAKVRKDAKGSIFSWSIHNSICQWRLQTLEPSERSEWALLVAYIGCAGLQAIDSSPRPAMRYSSIVKHCRRILQSHLKPEDTEAPNGTLCHQYGFVMACFAQFYSQSQCPAEAKEIFEGAIKYEMVIQGLSWPKDLHSLNLVKGLAISMWKQGNIEQAIETFKFLFKSSTHLFGAKDELTLWAANQLRDIRDRKITHAEHEQRALVATSGPKRREEQGIDVNVVRTTDMAPEYLSTDISDEEWSLLQMVEESLLQFGELHTVTITAIGKVAEFYNIEQKYSAAEGWFERLWRSLISQQGVTSIPTLRALEDLVQIYKKSGRYITGSSESMGQCLQEFLIGDAVIKIPTPEGARAICYAIQNCDELVLRLLIEWGADVNARSKNDDTPLYLAARTGLLSHVRLLIQQGAELNVHTERRGSALTGAARAGHRDVVQLLLDAGSDVNNCGMSDTALMYAAMEGYEKVVQLLLERGADPDIQESAGMTALHNAAYRGHEKVI